MRTLPPSVAVVDDDLSIRKSIERLLNAHGFTTEVFASAEAFLSRGYLNQITCLVLDIHLGGMSGIELQRQLVAAGTKLPVIFITAIDEEDLELAALEAGCVAYLHKPFPAASLIGAIRKALPDLPPE